MMFKDLRESPQVIAPSFLMGFSVFILLQLSREIPHPEISDFWFSYFVASAALFYRSFVHEHQSRNFALYRAAGISLQKLFWSHVFTQTLRLCSIALLLLTILAAFGIHSFSLVILSLCVSTTLAPFATFLGLGLKAEREFLFSFVYFPFVTPVVLAGVALSHDINSPVWWSLLAIFALGTSFLAAIGFEFFFDDLTS